MKRAGSDDALRCSFCHKSQDVVGKLISSPNDYPRAYICDECIAVCNSILEDDRHDQPYGAPHKLPKPLELKEYLDQYVIGQDGTKKKLAVAVYNHYKRIQMNKQRGAEVELSKSNILLIGPTGTGKTLLAQTLARILDVPFAIVDATTLTEAGYVGEDVENIILRLLQNSDWDVQRCQQGIIYIDEIDKIGRKDENPSITRDVSGRRRAAGAAQDPGRYGCQRSSAGWPQASAPGIHAGRHHQHPLYLRWRFRRSGKGDLEARRHQVAWVSCNRKSIARKARLPRTASNRRDVDLLENVQPVDLIKFGFIPEFIGRMPVVAVLEDLSKEALVQILTKPKNAIVRQYQKLFEFENVRLKFSDDALEAIAALAMERKVGARGLRMILEDLMLDLMYYLPSYKKVREFLVTKEMVMTQKINMALLEKAG